MICSNMEVTYLTHMGDDLFVANSARVSMAKHHDVFDELTDTKLINYLARENHFTPFAHPHISFRIKAPIFVARQLVKHQVGLVWNEESRRYIDSEPEFWFPKTLRNRPDGSIKQGSGGEHEASEQWLDANRDLVKHALSHYNLMIGDGIAPEQARMILPQNAMTQWYWSGSLAAFARVCKLRLDPHAQQETQEVAKMIANEVSKLFPVSWRALNDN